MTFFHKWKEPDNYDHCGPNPKLKFGLNYWRYKDGSFYIVLVLPVLPLPESYWFKEISNTGILRRTKLYIRLDLVWERTKGKTYNLLPEVWFWILPRGRYKNLSAWILDKKKTSNYSDNGIITHWL